MMSREDDLNANSKDFTTQRCTTGYSNKLEFFLRQDYIFAAEFRREKSIT